MRTLLLIAITMIGMQNSVALATLGGDDSSVDSDSHQLGSPQTITHHSVYDLHEIAQSRVRLHEFIGHDGKVFAVAWKGISHPDLSKLLGDHLQEYQSAISQARRGNRHGGSMVIDSQNLHIELGGHMMSVHGRVWLKDRMPSELDPNEVQ